MKNLLFIRSLAGLIPLFLTGCDEEPSFDLSKKQAIAEALKNGGEIVDVVGDPGPYRFAFTMITPTPVDKQADPGTGSAGFSLGGHTLTYPTSSTDYYHVITSFDTASGGGLLIGTRHPVDQSRYAKAAVAMD